MVFIYPAIHPNVGVNYLFYTKLGANLNDVEYFYTSNELSQFATKPIYINNIYKLFAFELNAASCPIYSMYNNALESWISNYLLEICSFRLHTCNNVKPYFLYFIPIAPATFALDVLG